MKRTYLFLLLLLSLLRLTLPVSAQLAPVPNLMHFQGRLVRPDGTPVPDGTYALRFSLWSAVSGGNERWKQFVSSVTVRSGTFAVLLSDFPAGLFNNDNWLEITIENDKPLTPRQQLVSVAYALKAGSVSDGAIGTNALANGAITGDKLASGLLNPLAWLLGGNAGTNPASQFLGTTDNQPLVFRTNNAERLRLSASGSLGLGTANPQGLLHLLGSAAPPAGVAGGNNGLLLGSHGEASYKWIQSYNGALVLNPQGNLLGIGTTSPDRAVTVSTGGATYVNIKANSGAQEVLLGVDVGGAILSAMTNNHLIFRSGGNVDRMIILNTGNVGIGTLSPASRLTVNGDTRILGSGNGVVFPDGSRLTTGSVWGLSGNAGTNASVNFLGTTDNQPLVLKANSQQAVRYSYDPTLFYRGVNVLANADLNVLASGVSGATIAGGGLTDAFSTSQPNIIVDTGGTIGGGAGNVGGSDDGNVLSALYTVIAGGVNNIASGASATVGGGELNTASRDYATVPGGFRNTADGRAAFAGGFRAQALHEGAFVWSDVSNTLAAFSSTAANQFSVRAAGGVRFFSNNNLTAGVTLAGGGGAWSSVSDRHAKTNVLPVDSEAILERLLQIPIATWNYKSQDAAIRHIGPMAQDFFAAFGVGEDERRITTIDADGVALAGIQGLYRRLQKQQQAMTALQAAHRNEVDALKARNAALEARLSAIEAALTKHKAGR